METPALTARIEDGNTTPSDGPGTEPLETSAEASAFDTEDKDLLQADSLDAACIQQPAEVTGVQVQEPAVPEVRTGAPVASVPGAPEVRQSHPLDEVIASQLQSLDGYYRGVLDTEDVEAVHKMRVTTRRLQASLDLLQGRPDDLGIRKLKRRLRRWRRCLSLVRNYDVFLSMVDAESQQPVRKRDYELIRAELLKRRTRQAFRVDTYLQRVQIWSIGDKLRISRPSPVPTDLDTAGAEASAPEPILEGIAAEPAVHHTDAGRPQPALLIDERKVARRAADRMDQRLAEFQALAAEARPTTDPAEIHRLRIAAKRLRYLMEAVSRLGYGDARRAIDWLRLLQDNLGDWHDIDAFEEEIVDIVSRRKFMKGNLPETAAVLYATALLSRKKERLIRKIFPVKPPAVLRGTSNRLARALRRTASSAPAAKTA